MSSRCVAGQEERLLPWRADREVRYDASAMTTDEMDFDIKTESRGAHWIAWVTRGASDKPLDSVILVGQTRDEAVAEASIWADKLAADPMLIRTKLT